MQELLSRLQRILELHIRIEKMMRSVDLTMSAKDQALDYQDFRALGCVLTHGPITLKQAAEALQLPKTTLHYIMQKLTAASYMERSIGKKRSIPFFAITPAGREVWGRQAQALFDGPFGRALTRLSDAELAARLEAVRDLWVDAGEGAQNETIFLEATILAVAVAESLLSGPEGDQNRLEMDRTLAPPEALGSS